MTCPWETTQPTRPSAGCTPDVSWFALAACSFGVQWSTAPINTEPQNQPGFLWWWRCAPASWHLHSYSAGLATRLKERYEKMSSEDAGSPNLAISSFWIKPSEVRHKAIQIDPYLMTSWLSTARLLEVQMSQHPTPSQRGSRDQDLNVAIRVQILHQEP